MADKVKLEGFKELHDALGQLNKSTERTLLRRLAKRALEPMQARAKQLVPVEEGKLRDSIVIGSRLAGRARIADRKEPKSGVRLFLGTAVRYAVAVEFGTFRASAHPYMRPAWDSESGTALHIVKRDLGKEIEATAARAAKRKAKAK